MSQSSHILVLINMKRKTAQSHLYANMLGVARCTTKVRTLKLTYGHTLEKNRIYAAGKTVTGDLPDLTNLPVIDGHTQERRNIHAPFA